MELYTYIYIYILWHSVWSEWAFQPCAWRCLQQKMFHSAGAACCESECRKGQRRLSNLKQLLHTQNSHAQSPWVFRGTRLPQVTTTAVCRLSNTFEIPFRHFTSFKLKYCSDRNLQHWQQIAQFRFPDRGGPKLESRSKSQWLCKLELEYLGKPHKWFWLQDVQNLPGEL